MRTAIFSGGLLLIGFGLGFLAGQWRNAGLHQASFSTDTVSLSQARSTRPPAPEFRIGREMTPEQGAYDKLYNRLGLQNGDTIHSVNGEKAPSGFVRLLPAFRDGNLCIRYERASQEREVCYRRDQAGGEHVTDGPSA